MANLWVTRRHIEANKAFYGPDFYSIEDVRAECRYNREQWRKALVALWTTREEELSDGPFWRRAGIRLACTIAMLLGRSYREPDDWFHAWTVAFWDAEQSGYGWSAQTLDFHPRRWRFTIGSDGECTM